MQIYGSFSELSALRQPVHWAMGFFDGVHVGHSRVILSADTPGALRGALTFSSHPLALLRPGQQPPLLTPDADYKASLIAAMGTDVLLRLPFTPELAALRPQEFLDTLCRACRVAGISAGANWRFGCSGAGSTDLLQHEGARRGFRVCACDLTMVGCRPVNSTRIRSALQEGRLEETAALLGRPFAICGTVEHGQQLARQLGFPTANISGLQGAALPPFGVYGVRCTIDGATLRGIANLGLRPTIREQVKIPRLEVHFPGWQGNLYGRRLAVELRSFLRPELAFDSVDALRAQIRRDISAFCTI